MSMTKHKQRKSRRRAKLVKKGAYSGTDTRIGNLRKEARERLRPPEPSISKLLKGGKNES